MLILVSVLIVVAVLIIGVPVDSRYWNISSLGLHLGMQLITLTLIPS